MCFDMQFTKAVEAKQVAQQDAERARFVVLKADQVLPSACSYACPDFLVHRAFAIFLFPSGLLKDLPAAELFTACLCRRTQLVMLMQVADAPNCVELCTVGFSKHQALKDLPRPCHALHWALLYCIHLCILVRA